ncbi:unnamed protein product, partial [Ectocarpus sp. 13 AM-2016]
LLALPKTVAETVGIPPTADNATASWSCESLVRFATGVLHSSFVGMRCQWSEDYGLDDSEYQPTNQPPFAPPPLSRSWVFEAWQRVLLDSNRDRPRHFVLCSCSRSRAYFSCGCLVVCVEGCQALFFFEFGRVPLRVRVRLFCNV